MSNMVDDTLENLMILPGGSRGRHGSSGDLPAAMRQLKQRTLEKGEEIIVMYEQTSRKNTSPTATNIRSGKVAGLLGFNADWREEDGRQVLRFSYTGRWHAKTDPPQEAEHLERGPFGYTSDYELHKVETAV